MAARLQRGGGQARLSMSCHKFGPEARLMSEIAIDPFHDMPGGHDPRVGARPDMANRTGWIGAIVFIALLALGLGFTVHGLTGAIDESGTPPLAIGVFVMLGIALLIALAFEFVNGFHDTANAVATVIYTHSMPAQLAVVWSGSFNFLGVLTSSGTVAFAIVQLLPVELILQVGAGAGFAMIFALLIAAIIWNLGTWYLGLPASSSHTLVGSIIGVGLANQLMAPAGVATSGVDWGQALGVFKALLFSPVIGFVGSALLLLVMRVFIKSKKLYTAPEGKKPPPLWIRGLLIFTCTSVSFAHGSNDGQKGMGLIMLILIGSVPTAFALNRAVPDSYMPSFIAASETVAGTFQARANGTQVPPADARAAVTEALKARAFEDPKVFAALGDLSSEIASQVKSYGTLNKVPAAQVENIRNEMFLVSEAIRVMEKKHFAFTPEEKTAVDGYKKALDASTKFIPVWVKVAVAVALGLGTMVGWKRIVVTVGEKIGKTHLTYGQGAAAELVAAATIVGADVYGLPVSTTHVLTSGVAGTMAANGSGLDMGTVRNLVMAWVLTLPVAILLSGSLFFLFRAIM
jgi:PiT family inorganic phosphate transporter